MIRPHTIFITLLGTRNQTSIKFLDAYTYVATQFTMLASTI